MGSAGGAAAGGPAADWTVGQTAGWAAMACGGTSIRPSSACTSARLASAPQPASVVTMPITSGAVSVAWSLPLSLWLSMSGCSPTDRASCCWVRPTTRRCSRTAARNRSRSRIRFSPPNARWRTA